MIAPAVAELYRADRKQHPTIPAHCALRGAKRRFSRDVMLRLHGVEPDEIRDSVHDAYGIDHRVVRSGHTLSFEVDRSMGEGDACPDVVSSHVTGRQHDGWGRRGRDTGSFVVHRGYHNSTRTELQLANDLCGPGSITGYPGMSKQNSYLAGCAVQGAVVEQWQQWADGNYGLIQIDVSLPDGTQESTNVWADFDDGACWAYAVEEALDLLVQLITAG